MKKYNGKTWDELKKGLTSLTPIEKAEIDLRVQIVGKIIEARHDQQITQRALEELSGVRQPIIARLEKGSTDPQLSTILRILRPLGMTLAVVPDNRTQPQG